MIVHLPRLGADLDELARRAAPMTPPQYVRVKDASLVRSILTEGRVYECKGAEHDNYLVGGLWLHRGRFEAATYADWAREVGQ